MVLYSQIMACESLLKVSDWVATRHLRLLLIILALLVIAIYSKSGGKNGKHCSITESSNIGAISYIAAQLFEFMHGRQSRHTPEATARLQTRQFTLSASMGFLTILSTQPRIHGMTGTLELTVEDT